MMEAGEALDTLVAERVMGWTADDTGWVKPDGGTRERDRWSPSSSRFDAWTVLEHLLRQGWEVTLSGSAPGEWVVRFTRAGAGSEQASALSTSLSHAICLGALAAMRG